ncbi:MAG: hypothetical protein L0Y72_22175 [Gemmataceae bacterium]|nr:hypothetical protein [Gemmataceae bacterium]
MQQIIVRFPSDPNDESGKVSVDSFRIEAGDAQHFIGGKLRCDQLSAAQVHEDPAPLFMP